MNSMHVAHLRGLAAASCTQLRDEGVERKAHLSMAAFRSHRGNQLSLLAESSVINAFYPIVPTTLAKKREGLLRTTVSLAVGNVFPLN